MYQALPLITHRTNETESIKTTLVLLHGWGFHVGVFDRLIKSISETSELQHIHCIPLNLPMEASYSCEQNIIAHIADKLLAQSPPQAIWLGWSLGGLIAQWIAIHHPHRVKALINVSSSPRFLEGPKWMGMSIEYFESFARRLKQDVHKTLMEFVMLNTHPKQDKQNILFLKKSLSINSINPLQNLKTLECGLELLKNTDLRSSVSQIKCPSLYLFGENDCLVNSSNLSHLARLISNGKCLVFENEGHAPFLSSEKQFINEMCSFLLKYDIHDDSK